MDDLIRTGEGERGFRGMVFKEYWSDPVKAGRGQHETPSLLILATLPVIPPPASHVIPQRLKRAQVSSSHHGEPVRWAAVKRSDQSPLASHRVANSTTSSHATWSISYSWLEREELWGGGSLTLQTWRRVF